MRAPVGRPTASTHTRRSARSWAGSDLISATEVSPESERFSRISAPRLDVIRAALTDDELAVVRFLAEVRLATGVQIARRLWAAPAPTAPSARSARRTLARLESLLLIQRLGRRMGGVRGGSTSIVYGLASAGHRLLAPDGRGRGRGLGTPGDRHVAHTLDVCELVVRLSEASLRGQLELLGEIQTEPVCWRRFAGVMGTRQILKPDMAVCIGAGRDEDRWFIEVDRATESDATIHTKASRYLAHLHSGNEQRAHGVYPRVLWTAPNASRRMRLRGILERLPDPAPRLHTVWTFDEVVGRLAAEARS